MIVTHRRVLLSALPLLLLALGRPASCQQDASARGVAAEVPAVPVLDDDIVDRIIKEGIDNSQAMKLLRGLTSIGHRLTGSDNYTKACNWTLSEFHRMGLEARLEKWSEWKLVWNRGAWVGRIVSEPKVDMYVATEAWTAGTKGLQRGKLVRAPKDVAEFEARKGELAGAYVYRTGTWQTREPQRDADREAYRQFMAVKKLCNEAGVLGWVYGAAGGGGYPTRVRVFGEHETAMKNLADVPTVPEIAVRSDHAKDLDKRLAGGKEVLVEFDIQNAFREGPIVLHNVIAELKGSDKPDEAVIISSHLDSWHQATGTTDNGTGTNSTMESARILTSVGAKPRRTIRFCLWGGEEENLLGSRGYVMQHRGEMNKVSCVFNHDSGTNWAQGMSVTHGMYEPMRRVFAPVTKLKPPDADFDGRVFNLRAIDQISGGGGSDHASFIAAGVPGLNWNLTGRSDYFNYTWHSQWDTIDVAIEEYQRHTATVIALAALGVANLPDLLDRSGVNRGAGQGTPQGQTIATGVFEAEFEGMKFTKVNPGGRAEKLGIKAGDVLQKVNGNNVRQWFEVFSPLREEPRPAELVLTLLRGEGTAEVRVKTADLAGVPMQPSEQGRGGRGGRGGAAARTLFDADLEGARFTRVDKDGRGDKLGFREGDVIKKVDGKEATADDFFRALRAEPAPAELVVTVQRGEGTAEVRVKPAELASAQQQGRGGRGGRGGGAAGGRMLFDADMEGIKFTRLDKDGRGDKAGFLDGDVIQKVNGKDVNAPEDIFRVLRADPAPAELVFTVQRGEGTAEVKVKAADLSAGRRAGRGAEEAVQGGRRGG